MAEHREIERTYAPTRRRRSFPTCARSPAWPSSDAEQVDELDAVYFDTADLALTRAGVSLRRRTAARTRAGTSRSRPTRAATRSGSRWAGRGTQPPARAAARSWSRGPQGAAARPIATDRHPAYPTRPARGRRDGPGRGRRRRGDRHAGGQCRPGRLAGVGARAGGRATRTCSRPPTSCWRSRGRAERGAAQDPARARRPGAGRRRCPRSAVDLPAARVLQRRLIRQVTELKRRDSLIRRRQDEGVHQARVACRRLRSALATYRPLVDREVTDPIRDEIKWLGQTLADARDATVVRERLRAMVDAEPNDVVVGPGTPPARHDVRRAVQGGVGPGRRRPCRPTATSRCSTPSTAWSPTRPGPTRPSGPPRRCCRGRVRKDWRRLKRPDGGRRRGGGPGGRAARGPQGRQAAAVRRRGGAHRVGQGRQAAGEGGQGAHLAPRRAPGHRDEPTSAARDRGRRPTRRGRAR